MTFCIENYFERNVQRQKTFFEDFFFLNHCPARSKTRHEFCTSKETTGRLRLWLVRSSSVFHARLKLILILFPGPSLVLLHPFAQKWAALTGVYTMIRSRYGSLCFRSARAKITNEDERIKIGNAMDWSSVSTPSPLIIFSRPDHWRHNHVQQSWFISSTPCSRIQKKRCWTLFTRITRRTLLLTVSR